MEQVFWKKSMSQQIRVSELDDNELACLAVNDSSSFAELYDRYFEKIFYYLLDITKSMAVAEDLTSETFMYAFKAIGTLRNKNSFRPWLYQIAKNKSYDYFRQKKKGNEIPLEFVEELESKTTSEFHYAPEEIILVRNIIDNLPEDEAELLRLRFVAELSFSDIAKVLKQSVNVTKKKFYKIIKKISTEVKR